MEKRQVKLDIILAGKCAKSTHNMLNWDAAAIHECMVQQVKEQFEQSPIFLPPKVLAAANLNTYPEFYAAGWFISDQPLTDTEGKLSELVVVAHGKSLKEARTNMLKETSNVSWDEFAKNV